MTCKPPQIVLGHPPGLLVVGRCALHVTLGLAPHDVCARPVPSAIPTNAITWNGEVITWNGEVITWS